MSGTSATRCSNQADLGFLAEGCGTNASGSGLGGTGRNKTSWSPSLRTVLFLATGIFQAPSILILRWAWPFWSNFQIGFLLIAACLHGPKRVHEQRPMTGVHFGLGRRRVKRQDPRSVILAQQIEDTDADGRAVGGGFLLRPDVKLAAQGGDHELAWRMLLANDHILLWLQVDSQGLFRSGVLTLGLSDPSEEFCSPLREQKSKFEGGRNCVQPCSSTASGLFLAVRQSPCKKLAADTEAVVPSSSRSVTLSADMSSIAACSASAFLTTSCPAWKP